MIRAPLGILVSELAIDQEQRCVQFLSSDIAVVVVAIDHERGYTPMLHEDWLLINLVAQLTWQVKEPEDMSTIFAELRHRVDDGLARHALGRVSNSAKLAVEVGSHGEVVDCGRGIVSVLRTGRRC